MRHMPTFISVEPANICQLRCPECPVGLRKNPTNASHYLSMELFENILSQVHATAHTMQFYFQGEPLLNQRLPEMIALARKTGLYTIVSTNANALDKDTANALIQSGLNRIIVSIDGFSDESYTAYRVGGSLAKALDGLRFLREAKDRYASSICIELQVLRLRTNEHEWQWIRSHYKRLGATRLVFKTAQLYDYEHGNPLMPSDERYSRYKKGADGTYHLHRSWARQHWHTHPCFRLWSGCVITTTGDVLPCCYDKTHQYTLGNIQAQSLSAIFQSTKANTLRSKVLKDRKHLPEMCKNCDY